MASDNAKMDHVSSISSSRESKKQRSKSHTYVLTSQIAYGGGLILVEIEQKRMNLMPRPVVTDTLDGVGRPSPLEPETNYVGIRHLQNEEIKKLEGNQYNPSIQQQAEDVSEDFRPADTLDHEKWRNVAQKTDEKMVKLDKEREADKKQMAAFPAMTRADPCNQYCENMMFAGPKPRALMHMNKKWGGKQQWIKQLPPTINSLPVFTIRVQWRLSNSIPCYSLELVHALLSQHGRILSMSQVSQNSAMVVFSDVQTARRALKCCKGVGSSKPLILSWWFPEMASYNKMIHEQRTREERKVFIHLNESTLMKMEFKKIQEKCIIQLKKYQWCLSYDRNSFVP